MKLTSNQLQWQKELKRIKSFIKRAEKRGYAFKDYKMPEAKPKRVTKKMLQELKSETTPTKLYKQAEYKDPFYGDKVSGTTGRKRERQRAYRKAHRKEWAQEVQSLPYEAPPVQATIYYTLESYLRRVASASSDYYFNLKGRRGVRGGYAEVIMYKSQVAEDLLTTLDNAVTTEGYAFYERLESEATTVNQFITDFEMASTQEQVNQAVVPLATILQGRPLTAEESKMYTDYGEIIQGMNLV